MSARATGGGHLWFKKGDMGVRYEIQIFARRGGTPNIHPKNP